MAFNGPVALELAAQFQALAEAEGATVPLMLGHLLAGISLVVTGDLATGKSELDRAIALYDPVEIARWQRDSATMSGCPPGLAGLCLMEAGRSGHVAHRKAERGGWCA